VARSTDGGSTYGRPVAADATVAKGVEQMRPAIAATAPGKAIVAFVDDRARFTGDDLPQAGIWAVRFQGARPGKAARMDSTAKPNDLAATLDNAWAPALAAHGRHVALTWIDFRDYEWNVYSRTSADGGATWAAEKLVNTTKDADEALEDTPRVDLAGATPVVAYTDWAKSADSATRPSPLYDIAVNTPGGRQQAKVDGTGTRHVDAFAPAIVARRGGNLVVWQDHRHGQADIYISRGGRPTRVDDTGTKPWNQWRPAIVATGKDVLAAWEDERDGPAQIFFARAPIRRVG